MNTTEKGDNFEDKVLTLLMKEIEGFNTFINPKNHIKVFKKKKYYSRFRKNDIEFDIAIEVYQDEKIPNYSSLILIECKDYKGPVGVDQVNKFLQDVRDLSEGNFSYNLKPIMAISSNLAKSAFNVALERNVGLIKINESDGLKWVLNRSFEKYGINQALSSKGVFVDSDQPNYYNSSWYFYSHNRWFSGFKDYLRYITGQKDEGLKSQVKYFSKDTLESMAKDILINIEYLDGVVCLSDLLSYEVLKSVKLYKDVIPSIHEKSLLGRVDFKSNEIFMYKKEVEDGKRDRFTLAHELSHILLGHSQYLDKDSLGEDDLASIEILDNSMVAKLEFQANYLASCLLVPNEQLAKVFSKIYSESGLKRRGAFWIYLDNQPENKMIANNIISKLARYFDVSKSVIKIRLIGFGLLHDERLKVL
ncbi:ImmA/IrrE family metallo-endopeptidase [Psychrobacter sp. DAB_AL62B]|uniref:ImmA/IrrE family metallo-endopeptidase n=1 Tax=Psychrobacter sp. DAB_AL62B TaxID=1028420 RepID=UPI00238107AF|nr:ImmA/IrrE family metallo-endopeptidase [Psychrobacter sp. DAB_AL62B]MDE4454259.1 ImmA/IrrE family metallo-endopeptidase [Psychrobacter sp. DAB_AL62B]